MWMYFVKQQSSCRRKAVLSPAGEVKIASKTLVEKGLRTCKRLGVSWELAFSMADGQESSLGEHSSRL